MKILRITLKNIVSLAGVHPVDFTRKPLVNAGLFAICGPTGSGKSTLLDALCLSLYDDTPRLSSNARAARMRDGDGEIVQTDVRNLLRRGTGEGFTEVAFVGVDGESYTARWAVRRTYGRVEKALQVSEMTLFRGNIFPGGEGIVAQGSKKKEVLAAIQEKVGLSFNQFTRAVLLAQNDFATFLKADDNERASILQALTDTAQFEAISKAVYLRYKEQEKELETVKSRMLGTAPLSAEAREVKDLEFQQAELEYTQAAQRCQRREEHAQWFVSHLKLASEVSAAIVVCQEREKDCVAAEARRTQLQDAEFISRDACLLRNEETWATEALGKSAEELAKAEAERIRADVLQNSTGELLERALVELHRAEAVLVSEGPQIQQARVLDAQLIPLEVSLKQAELRLGEASSAVVKAQMICTQQMKECEARILERTRVGLLQAKLSCVSPFVSNRGGWSEWLDQCIRARADLASAEEELRKRIELETQKTELESGERLQIEQIMRPQVANLSKVLEDAKVDAEQYDAESIAVQRERNDSAISAIEALRLHVQNWDVALKQYGDLEREIEALSAIRVKEWSRSAELENKLIPETQIQVNAARDSFELASAAVDAASVRLREKLRTGKPCPVCGGVEHPYTEQIPTEEVVVLRALREQSEERESVLKAFLVEQVGLDRSLKSVQGQTTEKAGQYQRVRAELDELRAFTSECEDAVALWRMDCDERPAAIQGRLDALQQVRKKLSEMEAARSGAEKRVKNALGSKEKVVKILAEAEARLTQAKLESVVAKTQRETAQSGCGIRQIEARERYAVLKPIWEQSPALEIEFNRSATVFRARFLANIEELASAEIAHARLSHEIVIAETTLKSLAEAEAQVQFERTKREVERDAVFQSCESVRQERARLLRGESTEIVEFRLKATIQAAREKHSSQLAEVSRASVQRSTAAANFTGATTVFEAAQQKQTLCSVRLNQWLLEFAQRRGRTLDRVGLDEVLRRDEAWFLQEKAFFVALDGAFKTAEGVLSTHLKSRASHEEMRPTQDDVEAVLVELALLKQTVADAKVIVDSHRASILNDDQRRAECAAFLQEIAERGRRIDPWRKLNDLVGSASGDAFRNIAQRTTLDMLLTYANAQLDLLASRYRLERIAQSLNLLVVDRDMADEQRSVHSLSGGESFLVSLALALGLASLTSNRIRIESLFIDEGFGSLDPETLSTATNALMHLQAQGRKVGVISHVTEMAEVIAVQIRVIKGRGGASRIETRGPGESVWPEAGESPRGEISEIKDSQRRRRERGKTDENL